MVVAPKNKQKRNKITPLYKMPKRLAPTPSSADIDSILEIIKNNPKAIFVVRSLSHCTDYNNYSARTLKSIIKKGYHDIDGWWIVNSAHKDKEQYLGSMGRVMYRSILVPDKTTGHVVFDFDDVPGIETKEDMLKLIESKGLPIPVFIVESSRRSYHVLYKAPYGTWTTEKKLEYAFKFIGENNVPDSITPIWISKLKTAGIDYNYLLQNTDMCKIRLPGSTRLSVRGHYICTFLYVEDADTDISKFVPGVEKISLVDAGGEEEEQLVSKNDAFYSSHYEKISNLIAPFLPKKHLSKLAKHLTTHLGFLFKDKCQLSQTEISKLVGISQPTVSRIIRSLVKANILTVLRDGFYRYKKGERGIPKTYGAGPELKKILKVTDEKVIRKQLAEPYQAGEANSKMLKDIGIMYKCGFPVEEIVRICDQKMRSRGSRRKSRNEIHRAVRRWEERQEGNFNRPVRPIIDPNTILTIIGDG